MSDAIKLRAISPKDVPIFSSLLQDSVLQVGDIAWQAGDHLFAAIFTRYRWEKKRGFWPFRRVPERVKSALHFNGVLSVESSGFDTEFIVHRFTGVEIIRIKVKSRIIFD